MGISGRQRLALTRPCLLAVETMHPCYRTVTGVWSEILTVNTGHE